MALAAANEQWQLRHYITLPEQILTIAPYKYGKRDPLAVSLAHFTGSADAHSASCQQGV